MNRAEWPEGYGATGGHGFWHLEGYYRPWSVGSDTERHDITTDEPGALSFAAMMADRDGLRAELAKVTAELDALSRTAEPFDVRTAWHLLREAADLSGAPFNEWSDWMGRAAFWRYPPDGYGPEPAFARTTPTEGETE